MKSVRILFRAQRNDGAGIVYGDLIRRGKNSNYSAIFERGTGWHYRIKEDSAEVRIDNGPWQPVEAE